MGSRKEAGLCEAQACDRLDPEARSNARARFAA